MGERVILHSDLNAFYASVEMMFDPSLKGKAVAVCGSTEDRHGIVLRHRFHCLSCAAVFTPVLSYAPFE